MTTPAKQRFEVDAGTMAYIDCGSAVDGTVVFVHGNPASSAEFLPAIEQLRDRYRCIAADHIGFGDSAKPTDWDYLPSSHATNLAALLDQLDVRSATVVVGDWGGPIGLSWVLDNPDRVSHLVVTNTWMWPVNRSLYYQCFSRAMGGFFGRYFIRNHNLFAERVVKSAWGKATPLTAQTHELFTGVHTVKDERKGMWVFPAEIVGSTDWLDGLWRRRETLRGIEMSLLWGMRDIAFRPDILEEWVEAFPDASVKRLPDVGHFVALEAIAELVATIVGAAADGEET